MTYDKDRMSFLRFCVWQVLFFFSRIVPCRPRMTVLMYHTVSHTKGFFVVSPEEFERQIQYLQKRFAVVPLSRAFQHATGIPVSRDSVAITFDDGYRDFKTEVLPVLNRYQIPATVFVLGDTPDRAELGNDFPLLSASEITTLTEEPLVTIGSHALSHKKLTRLSETELNHELVESRRQLEERTKTLLEYLAYPKGSHNEKVMEAVAQAGYKGAVSVIERGVRGGDNVFALPRVQVDAHTTLSLFRAKLSLASDWYYALWSFFAKK